MPTRKKKASTAKKKMNEIEAVKRSMAADKLKAALASRPRPAAPMAVNAAGTPQPTPGMQAPVRRPMGMPAPGSAPASPAASPPQFKKGGKVKKTGMAKVHKGERVLTTKQTKSYDKSKGKKC